MGYGYTSPRHGNALSTGSLRQLGITQQIFAHGRIPSILTSLGYIQQHRVIKSPVDSRAGLPILTDAWDVVAVLDYLNGHVVVIDARSFRVDAGETAAGVIVIAAVTRAGAFAAVSTIVAFANIRQRTDHRRTNEHRTRVGGASR